VTALLQRAGTATASPIDRVRDRLADGDEEGSIAAMAALSEDDAAKLVERTDLRALAVRCFNDEEMARAITSLKGGRLLHKLRWLKAEGSNLGLVWPLIVDKHTPAEQKRELFLHTEMRDFFVKVCGDDEMATVVDVLGGWLEAKLNWMFVEGTSWEAIKAKINAAPPKERLAIYDSNLQEDFEDKLNIGEMSVLVNMLGGTLDQKLRWMASKGTNGGLVFPKVRAAPADELAKVTPATRARIKDRLSSDDFGWFEQMLDRGVLRWENVDRPVDERHYELKDEDHPEKGWELKTMKWRACYEITYRRTELRVKVRIRFKGEASTPAHHKYWLDGIRRRWNGHFHFENDRRLRIVFEPIVVESDAHQTVNLRKGPPVKRPDMSHWTVGPTMNADASKPPDTTDADMAAHEFGHMLGLEDEYRLPEKEFKRLLGRDPTPADKEVDIGYMGTPLMQWGGSDVEERHLKWYLDWLNRNRLSGEQPFRLVAGG
jgi:hypothetical protein